MTTTTVLVTYTESVTSTVNVEVDRDDLARWLGEQHKAGFYAAFADADPTNVDLLAYYLADEDEHGETRWEDAVVNDGAPAFVSVDDRAFAGCEVAP